MANPSSDRRPAGIVRAEYGHAMDRAHIERVKLNCSENPVLFTDFAEHGLDAPTAEEAATLCGGCPLLTICDEFSQVVRPESMVQGGRYWGKDRRAVKARKSGEVEPMLKAA